MRSIKRGVRIELLSAKQLKLGQNVPAGIFPPWSSTCAMQQ
jgi:hypothetical protein